MTSYTLVTPPASLAVPLDDVKAHLRVDSTAEDDLITHYTKAATSFCENYTHRAFITQTWKAVLPEFPSSEIRLARPPLASVTTAVYTDADGTAQNFTTYETDTSSLVGSIRPTYGTNWPTTQTDAPDAVQITYVCGYGSSPSDLPFEATMAVKLMAAHYFEMRQPVVLGITATTIPFAVESLLRQISVPEVA